MTVSINDRARLRHMGFTDREIDEIHNATDPKGNKQPDINLNDSHWQSAMANRRRLRDKIEADYFKKNRIAATKQQIDKVMDSFYRGGGRRNPFDFVVETYGKGSKAKPNPFGEASKRISKDKLAKANYNASAMQTEALKWANKGVR